MSKFLEEYGGLICAVIIASFLFTFLFLGREACYSLLNNRVVGGENAEYYDKDVENLNSIIPDKPPEISVFNNYIVEVGDEFNPKDCIISAYGNTKPESMNIEILPVSTCQSMNSIINSLKAGTVTVACKKAIDTSRTGEYEVVFYVRNSTGACLWAKGTCVLNVEVFDTSDEENL